VACASFVLTKRSAPPSRTRTRTPTHIHIHTYRPPLPPPQVSIWKSPDLSSGSWEFVGNAVECGSAPGCLILYRPHLVFNPNTKLFVLFYNYVSVDGPSRNGVATATSPAGPFTIVRPVMKTARPSLPSNHDASVGDFDVLVDTDGAAYVDTPCHHRPTQAALKSSWSCVRCCGCA
jgi:hypothetical protein